MMRMRNSALLAGYDAVLADLDGVVYAGPDAIPGAVAALLGLEKAGLSLGYITNNASRSPAEVAAHLRELGAPATDDQVVSSAQAGAALLAERFPSRQYPSGQYPSGAPVLIIGSAALADEVRAVGLRPVYSADEQPVAVIQGFDPELGWQSLAEATYAVRAGALWVATNTDMTIPRDRGIAPGNGTLVAAVQAAVGGSPVVAGKPEAPLFYAAAERLKSCRPLIVGDRLDTDILGGTNAGMDTAVVLTGVDTLMSILAARTAERPTYLLADLGGLYEPYPDVSWKEGVYQCGNASARLDDGRIRVRDTTRDGSGAVTEEGRPADEDLDGWRAACAAWWAAHPDAATATEPAFVR